MEECCTQCARKTYAVIVDPLEAHFVYEYVMWTSVYGYVKIGDVEISTKGEEQRSEEQ